MQHKSDLIFAAAAIARTSPENWAAFLLALSVHVDAQKDILVNSQSVDLPKMQGRVQSLVLLHKALSECKQEAEKIANAERAKK